MAPPVHWPLQHHLHIQKKIPFHLSLSLQSQEDLKLNLPTPSHLRHINFCLLDGIWILPWEINRLLLCLWQWEIFKDRIRIHNCLFTQDKRIICIQILFSGYNLILVKAFGCGKKLLSESDSGKCFGMWTKEQKNFLYLNYFLMTESLFGPGQWFCQQEII